MDLNRVFLIGHVVKEVEVKKLDSGKQCARILVATNFKKGKEGESEALFHEVVAWDKLAEIAASYLAKGKKVFFEGRLDYRSWVDKENKKHFRTQIVADEMILLDRKNPVGEVSREETEEGSVKVGLSEDPFGSAA
ncbi:MAG: single-strand DNA-binding protein [Parcubacteria group bacterium Gr01-1014_18]|nr:MAG: single-strand DNA-binding protein [Parcubacteria group bacterium Greene0416_36]TSC81337.1 MAG: single-strand DNA-binding protein [Parcubacteria group bacterium Gr01-1014_18]TSC99477.1 MAG: single-strand DNA-binding protein [Parcubacteria group bacterium Greene1014_20]TSD07604.1 MAG: single-strand DNA-binding protein [Parcubacteria group bacterium Greene0714_2]